MKSPNHGEDHTNLLRTPHSNCLMLKPKSLKQISAHSLISKIRPLFSQQTEFKVFKMHIVTLLDGVTKQPTEVTKWNRALFCLLALESIVRGIVEWPSLWQGYEGAACSLDTYQEAEQVGVTWESSSDPASQRWTQPSRVSQHSKWLHKLTVPAKTSALGGLFLIRQ